MNNSYRIIWNSALGLWQVVAETARGRGKSRSLRRRTGATLALLAAGIAHAGGLPSGGSVVAGSGSIAQAGNSLTVNQGSDKLAIDWNSFSIGAGHTVNFVQPSASSVALNRVLGSDVSVIQGALTANGQVFLINPNGVLFSPTAQVNVGALVASTLNLSTADFMAGSYRFEGGSSNAIVNQGQVTAAPGGAIALIAAKVTNSGVLNAAQGQVLMGAGSRVTLDLGGPVKIEVRQGTLDALIEQGGAVRADGGLVYLTAQALGELTRTVINHTGITEAQTLASGATGQVYLMGGMAHDRIVVGGTLDASAPHGGNGGFIETSAGDVRIDGSLRVSTRAPQGRTGTWLIDPNDYRIAASGGHISGAQLSSQLANTNVVIETATQGTAGGNGDILVNDDIAWGSNHTLTLKAERDIHFGSGRITHASGTGDLVLRSDSDANGTGAITFANPQARAIDFSGSHGNIRLYYNPTGSGFGKYRAPTSFDQTIRMGGGALSPYMLVNSGQDLVDFLTSTYGFAFGFAALGRDIDPGAGNSLGALSGGMFRGVFDGDGHTISNMTIGGGGMFAYLVGAVLKNITLDASNTIAFGVNRSGGAFADRAQGSVFENLVNRADVTFAGAPFNWGGGIVSQFTDGVMINVENHGTIYAGANTQITGGIAARIQNSSLYRVRNYGDIVAGSSLPAADSGGHSVGGIVGDSYQSRLVDVQNHGNIRAFLANSTPDTQQITVGGILGWSFEDQIAYAEQRGNITVSVQGRSYVGGIAGRVTDRGTPLIAHDLYTQGNVDITATRSTSGDSHLFFGGLFGSVDSQSMVVGKNLINNAISQFTLALATDLDSNRVFTAGLVGSVSQPSEIRDAHWNAAGTALKFANGAYNGAGAGLVMSNTGAKTQAELLNAATYNGSWSNWLFDDAGAGQPLGSVPRIKPVLIAYSEPMAKYYDGQAYSAEAAAAHIQVAGGTRGDVTGSATVTGSYIGAIQANSWSDYSTQTQGAQLGGLNAADTDTQVLVNAGNLFVIKPRPITVTPDKVSKFYGDADALTWQITSGQMLGTDTLSGSLNRNAGENSGTYSVYASNLTAGSNYHLTKSSGTLTIKPRPITVTVTDQSKVYGDADPSLGWQITAGNLVGADTIGGSVFRTPGENVGNYALNANMLTASNNYAVTRVHGKLTVTPRPITVTLDDQAKTYGQADPTLTWQVTSGSLKAGDTLTGGVSRSAGENAGHHTIGGSTLANGNYLVTVNQGVLTIDPRPITVTPDSLTKVYGNADPSLTWQITGGSLINGDLLNGALVRTAGENVGSYAIDGSTLANGNYAITVQGGTLTVTPRPIGITVDSQSKSFGSADPALTWQVSSGNLVGSDRIEGSLTRAPGEASGDYVIDASQLANGNYLVTARNGVLTILAKPTPTPTPTPTPQPGDSAPQDVAQQTAHGTAQGAAQQATHAAGNTAGMPTTLALANATPPAATADGSRHLGASGGLVFVDAGATAAADTARNPQGFMTVFVVAGGIRMPQQPVQANHPNDE